MRRVGIIAGNTFRETVRNKVMYVLVLFAVLLILGSIALGKLALGEEKRLIKDLGLATISLFGVIIAILLGVTVVHREIERKTVYFVIPKPLRRTEFVLGKFFGLVVTLAIQVVAMSVVFALVLMVYGGLPTVVLIKALLLTLVEVIVVAAVALFLSSLSGPVIAGFLSLAIFVIGRSSTFVKSLAAPGADGWGGTEILLQIAYYVLPDYHLYAVSGAVAAQEGMSIHTNFFSWGYVGYAVGYGLVYVTILLGLTALRFARKDFV